MARVSSRKPLAEQRDIRGTALYQDIERLSRDWYRPGSGAVVDLIDVAVAPDGRRAAFSGVMLDKLEGAATTRICIADLASGELRVASFGPGTDRLPRWSPDGTTIAFLSDRAAPGNFQLYVLDVASGTASAITGIGGFVEYLHWSPDGRQILLGVAGFGAELAGAQGGYASPRQAEALPAWLPEIEAGLAENTWRSLWLVDVATRYVRRASPPGLNVWEAAWCGDGAAVAICSPAPGEEAWYRARLQRIDLRTGRAHELYAPSDQLGCVSATPSGRRVAVVEAVCSDRLVVAGDLLVHELSSGRRRRIDTRGLDVTFTQWQDEHSLLVAGVRAFETVIGVVDARRGTMRELLASAERSCGSRYPEVSGVPGRPGECAFSWEGFTAAPVLASLRRGRLRTICSFTPAGREKNVRALIASEPVRWKAPDGLEIHGWLHRPRRRGPHPLVVDIHGGPVWQWRPRYLAKPFLYPYALLERGYAVFQPNPRGSSGRGQDYARKVFGDMGGADTHDYLSGIDALVRRHIADPRRLGVTGGSYGGFMSSWLITQDARFKAAAPMAPVTNWVSEHLTCHIPHFCEMFLADQMTNAGGKYHSRSPVMFAANCRTPALNICGALDHNTPPGQALEFHRALRIHGCETVLLTYPQEGHGVRRFPAAIDFTARLVDWFTHHMPVRSRRS